MWTGKDFFRECDHWFKTKWFLKEWESKPFIVLVEVFSNAEALRQEGACLIWGIKRSLCGWRAMNKGESGSGWTGQTGQGETSQCLEAHNKVFEFLVWFSTENFGNCGQSKPLHRQRLYLCFFMQENDLT